MLNVRLVGIFGALAIGALWGRPLRSQEDARPFGIRMGQPVSQLGGVASADEPGVYAITRVPARHNQFSDYFVTATPQHGVCVVSAASPAIRTSGQGTAVLAEFDRIATSLAERYGTPGILTDNLELGALFDTPEYWMMSLLRKERIYHRYWFAPAPNLRYVALIVAATSPSSGHILITYSFTNSEACKAELARRSRDVL